MNWIEFSRKMLHDIANPLLAVRLQLWNLKNAEPGSLKEAVGKLEKELNYLESLIKNSREVLKMEASDEETSPLTAEEVREVFNGIGDELPKLSLHYELSDWEGLSISVPMLSMIIRELAINAKEAEAGRLTFERNGDRINCTDDGTPFSKGAIRDALIPYYSSKEKGMGLGLAKVQRALELFDGRLELEAAESPKQARIVLILPPAS